MGDSKNGILSSLSWFLIFGTGYYVYRQVNRSTQEIKLLNHLQEQNTPADFRRFSIANTMPLIYRCNKTALKNSQFDKLSQLKTLPISWKVVEHALAKSKYDSLETQIKAIQDVNDQFEKPAIVDGVLDTNAKAKSDAKFTDIKTGNTEIDKVLDKAISLGKSQQTSTLVQVQVKLAVLSQAKFKYD